MWPAVARCDQMLSGVTRCSQVLPGLTRWSNCWSGGQICDQVVKVLKSWGQMWQAVARCDQLMPGATSLPCMTIWSNLLLQQSSNNKNFCGTCTSEIKDQWAQIHVYNVVAQGPIKWVLGNFWNLCQGWHLCLGNFRLEHHVVASNGHFDQS